MDSRCTWCGGWRKAYQLCCRRCWYSLPPAMRHEVLTAFKEQEGSERHRAAVRACIALLAKKHEESKLNSARP